MPTKTNPVLAQAFVLLALAGGVAAEPIDPPSPLAGSESQTVADSERIAPRVEVERETVDLGTVTRGGSAEATFVLWNRGSDVLRVLSAKPG